MTSLGECLHFNMKNILTWFSRKSHLNMLWFQMKLSHFDSPEPLSARIHLAFSFLQRGTCSVKSHDQELPSLWRTLWIRPQSIKERSLMGWAMESPQKEGYCRYCRMFFFKYMFLFWRVTGHTALSTPIKETYVTILYRIYWSYWYTTIKSSKCIHYKGTCMTTTAAEISMLARCSPFYSWGTLDRWHPQDFLEHSQSFTNSFEGGLGHRFHGSCCVLPILISKDLSLHRLFFRSYVE